MFLFHLKLELWSISAEHPRKKVLKTFIFLVISPEIRKWVKIWPWGFFRDDEISSICRSNRDFFVSAGVFCSKLLFFEQKNFLKILSKNLFSTSPKFDGTKNHQILNIGFCNHMCLMCAHTINILEWPWYTSEPPNFVLRSNSTYKGR